MADAIVSIALERLAAIVEKQIAEEINLVRGVKKEVLYLSSELKAIRNVLDDAERRGYNEKSIKDWLKKLEDTSYDINDVLDEWNFAILKHQIEGSEDFVVPRQKVCSCLCFKKVATSHDIAKKMKGLKSRLDMVVKEKERYDFIVDQPADHRESDRVRSTSVVDVSEIHGREADKDHVVRKLMVDGVGGKKSTPCVISIVGTGGIGKTTLAQLVYNDDRVMNCFELRIWLCVSNVFDEVRIAKGILETLNKSSTDLSELETMLQCVKDSISGKSFLLVLDDVWTEDYTKWEPLKNSLKCGRPRSRILVTTRSERVARMMGSTEIQHLDQLSDTDCWLLMHRLAFSGRNEEDCEELQAIGKNIAKKCKGLPLAAKVLGSLLRSKDTVEEWENVLNSEIWQMEEAEVDLFPHLFLSYKELSPAMKHCFSYCAIFPKDSEIDVEKLIRMWMAQGYLSSNQSSSDLELKGREYFDKLRMHSFFVEYDGGNSCKMHDIVHDFALFLRKTNLEDPDDGRKNELFQDCDPSLLSQVKIYRSLFCRKELPSDLFDCTGCLRVLSLYECGLQELPRNVENLIHLRYLDLTGNKQIVQVPQTICKLYNLESLYLSNCGLKEIPREIGNLIHLRLLDLRLNAYIKELPETLCNLQDLRTLNLAYCASLSRLPEGLHRLINLRHLPNDYTQMLHQFPQGLEQLTELRTLRLFHAGRHGSKLGYLNKLNQLSGSIELKICLNHREDILEAQKAELRNKIHIRSLKIWFIDEVSWRKDEDQELVRMEAMEALQPPPNLRHLTILDYQGSKFPGWITTSLNNLKVLQIQECNCCSSLPPLGNLPRLEELSVWRMTRLEFLDKDFLGIGFPQLKKLSFWNCPSWKYWEDLQAEEAGGSTMSIFPCLRKLKIDACGLFELPHCILSKATSLEHLIIQDSFHLSECYEDKEGSAWRSLSHIPHVKVDYVQQRASYRSYETPLPVFYG